jgi:hypothetical protein
MFLGDFQAERTRGAGAACRPILDRDAALGGFLGLSAPDHMRVSRQELENREWPLCL